VHGSLWRDGENAFAGESETFRQFLAGWIAGARELAVFLAPNINSYKRYAAGSWAPTTLAWGYDNRTCGFRVVGHGGGARVETRIPGADVNPYLAFAALLAAGLYGIEAGLEPPAVFEGNAYESDVDRFPSSLSEAIGELAEGTIARAAFGDEVVDHYLNYARTEQRLFDQVVTCYERERLFERG
jgi:glutamine synthetase